MASWEWFDEFRLRALHLQAQAETDGESVLASGVLTATAVDLSVVEVEFSGTLVLGVEGEGESATGAFSGWSTRVVCTPVSGAPQDVSDVFAVLIWIGFPAAVLVAVDGGPTPSTGVHGYPGGGQPSPPVGYQAPDFELAWAWLAGYDLVLLDAPLVPIWNPAEITSIAQLATIGGSTGAYGPGGIMTGELGFPWPATNEQVIDPSAPPLTICTPSDNVFNGITFALTALNVGPSPPPNGPPLYEVYQFGS